MKKPKPPTRIADLKDSPFNPRAIGEDAMRGLRYSIDEFGDLSGITFNTRLRMLVTGHQRMAALKAKHGDALKIDGEFIVCPDGERFRLRLVEWDEDKTKAAILAANNAAIQGSFTDGAQTLIDDLKSDAPDLWDGLHLNDILKHIDGSTGEESETIQEGNDPKTLPPEMEIKPFEHYDYVLVMFKDSRDWMNFISRFPLQKRHFPLRNGKVKSVGDCRVLDGKVFLDQLDAPKT